MKPSSPRPSDLFAPSQRCVRCLVNDITRFLPCYLSIMKCYVLPLESNRLSKSPGSNSLVAFSMLDRVAEQGYLLPWHRSKSIYVKVASTRRHDQRNILSPGNESSVEAGGIYFRSGDMRAVNRSTPGDHRNLYRAATST